MAYRPAGSFRLERGYRTIFRIIARRPVYLVVLLFIVAGAGKRTEPVSNR